jgi:hypothetical protein
LKHPYHGKEVALCNELSSIVLGSIHSTDHDDLLSDINLLAIDQMSRVGENITSTYVNNGEPISSIYLPIFNSTTNTRTTVGIASFFIQWKTYLQSSITTSSPTIYCVFQTECQDSAYTYTINKKEVQFIGMGDLHETKFDSLKKSRTLLFDKIFSDGNSEEIDVQYALCPVTLHLYPSQNYSDIYHSRDPIMLASFVTGILGCIFVLFIMYDKLVDRRTKKVFKKAVQSSIVVSSLFPKNVLDKLTHDNSRCDQSADTNTLQGCLNNGFTDAIQETIADLFPHTTGTTLNCAYECRLLQEFLWIPVFLTFSYLRNPYL